MACWSLSVGWAIAIIGMVQIAFSATGEGGDPALNQAQLEARWCFTIERYGEWTTESATAVFLYPLIIIINQCQRIWPTFGHWLWNRPSNSVGNSSAFSAHCSWRLGFVLSKQWLGSGVPRPDHRPARLVGKSQVTLGQWTSNQWSMIVTVMRLHPASSYKVMDKDDQGR